MLVYPRHDASTTDVKSGTKTDLILTSTEQGASKGGLSDGNAGTIPGTSRDQVDNTTRTNDRDTNSTAASTPPPSKMADDTATNPEKGADNIKDDR